MDIQKEKDVIIKDINAMLKNMHEPFPWLAVEVALSMQSRIGKEDIFVAKVFENVLDDLSEEILDEYVPECVDNGGDLRQAAAGILGSFNVANTVSNLLHRPIFSLEEGVKEECEAWDNAENLTVVMGLGNASLVAQQKKRMIIQNIKADMQHLVEYKKILVNNAEEFKKEIQTIDIIAEVLNIDID